MTVRNRLQQHPLLSRWLPLLAWMGLIFFLSAQPDLPHPESGFLDLLLSSGGHVLLFGVLAALWRRVPAGRPGAWPPALTLTLLYALSDEFHQAFVPGRHPDPWDLVCDGLGAGLGLALYGWGQRRQNRPEQELRT